MELQILASHTALAMLINKFIKEIFWRIFHLRFGDIQQQRRNINLCNSLMNVEPTAATETTLSGNWDKTFLTLQGGDYCSQGHRGSVTGSYHLEFREI